MKRHTWLAFVTRALPLIALLLLFSYGFSYGQQADLDNIKAVITAYHSAIGALDISKMERLWAHDADVMLINPRDKSVSVGWDAVKKNWERTLAFWSELKVTQAEGPHIYVNGNVAWSTGVAHVEGKPKTGDAVNAPTFESDVFEKRGDAWLLVSHAAWRVPQ